jgi:hypothetical protein
MDCPVKTGTSLLLAALSRGWEVAVAIIRGRLMLRHDILRPFLCPLLSLCFVRIVSEIKLVVLQAAAADQVYMAGEVRIMRDKGGWNPQGVGP